MKMRKIRKIGSLLLLGVLLLLPAQIRAAQDAETSCTVALPVSVSVTADGKMTGAAVNPAENKDYEIVMTAEGEAPLPQESSIVVKGAGEGVFGPITYTEPGDYWYQIHQNHGNEKNILYDETSYTVLIQVVFNEENKLAAEIIVTENGSGKKADQIQFQNQGKVSNSTSVIKKPTAVITRTQKIAAKTGDELELGGIFAVAGVTFGVVVLLSVLMIKEKRKKGK